MNLLGIDRNWPHLVADHLHRRMRLPLRLGGLGVQACEFICDAAYVASVAETAHHIRRIAGELLVPPAATDTQAPSTIGPGGATSSPPPAIPVNEGPASAASAVSPHTRAPPTDSTFVQGLDAALARLATATGNAEVVRTLTVASIAEAAQPAVARDTRGPATVPDVPPRGLQKLFTAAIHDTALTSLLADLNADPDSEYGKRAATQLLSCGGEGGAWLTASPTHPYTAMPDAAFRAAVWLRLRIPFLSSAYPCTACKGAQMNDVYGDHAFSCTDERGERNERHFNVLTRVAYHTRKLRAHGHVVKAEKAVSYYWVNKANLKGKLTAHRADFTVSGQGEAFPLLGDVSVTSPFSSSTPKNAHLCAGVAALRGEADKIGHYLDVCTARKEQIVPIVFEVFGRAGPEVPKFLRFIASTCHSTVAPDGKLHHTMPDYVYALESSLRDIAVALQLANANTIDSWTSHIPPDLVHVPRRRALPPSTRQQRKRARVQAGLTAGDGTALKAARTLLTAAITGPQPPIPFPPTLSYGVTPVTEMWTPPRALPLAARFAIPSGTAPTQGTQQPSSLQPLQQTP